MRAIYAQTQRFGFGFGSKSNQIWYPSFLTAHYEALDLQRQTSIEAHNASVRRRPMRMSYPSIFGWSFWEKRRRRIREREALKGFWRERERERFVAVQVREKSLTLTVNSRFLLKLTCVFFFFLNCCPDSSNCRTTCTDSESEITNI